MTTMSKDVVDTWLVHYLLSGIYKLATKYASGNVSRITISPASFKSFQDAGMRVITMHATGTKISRL
jgi:hypothetical protein